jgi:hypothetical protein
LTKSHKPKGFILDTSEEERIHAILRRRLIEDIKEGEVRIYEKKDGVMTVRLMTEDDLDEQSPDTNSWPMQDSGLDCSF